MNWDELQRKTDFWIANNYNVLMVGEHGIGKTAVISEAFNRNKLRWRYFSASTMDPWVDFVGVPKEAIHEDGYTYLDLLRPLDLVQGGIDAYMFDEFNRAPDKVRNAVMELLQFKSINGRPVPGLKMVWAAINPYDENETYDVDEIDPAQEDRFEIQVTLPSGPNLNYFQSKYGARMGARACEWWNSLPDDIRRFVSPRRLDYAVDVFQKGGDLDDVLRPEVRPKTLKRKIESIDASTTHADRWLQDGEGYLKEVADRQSNIDVISAFAELADISMDQAVGYVTHLPSDKLNKLATSSDTVGILLRHFATTSPTHRRVETALKKIHDDMWHALFSFTVYTDVDPDLQTIAMGCSADNADAWKHLCTYVHEHTANGTLPFKRAVYILQMCILSGKRKETEDVCRPLVRFVESEYPLMFVEFVRYNPFFVASMYGTV